MNTRKLTSLTLTLSTIAWTLGCQQTSQTRTPVPTTAFRPAPMTLRPSTERTGGLSS